MRIGLPQEGLVCYKRSWIKGMKKKAEPPTTLVEFSQMFPNERACWDYLFAVRWPEGFICPRCGEHGGYIIEGRRVVECSAAKCRYHCSLTAGTVLHRTKQSLLSWFWAVYLVTSMTPGISAQQLQRQAGIRAYETAFCMLHKIRSALVAPGRDRLQGEVELDECYVGGKEEGRTGRGAEKKQIVIGGVELVRWQEPKSGRLSSLRPDSSRSSTRCIGKDPEKVCPFPHRPGGDRSHRWLAGLQLSPANWLQACHR